MRRETKAEREAWTALVEGREAKPMPKYGNERTQRYASNYEAEVAGKLWARQSCGQIRDLKEQVRIRLVEGNGKIRPIYYVADFVFYDLEDRRERVVDAKGCKTPVYRLKRKLAALLLGIDIEEV